MALPAARSVVDEGLPLAALEDVRLVLTLAPQRKLDGLSRFRLMLFEQGHTHPLLVATYDIAPDVPLRVVFHRVRGDARQLCARWYADRDDAQEYCAGGCGSTGMDLIDSEGGVQAHLKVDGWGSTTATAQLDMRVAERMVKELREAHRGRPARDCYTEMRVMLDGMRTMPLLWYALVAVQMRAQPEEGTRVLEHLLRVVDRFWPCDALGDTLALVVTAPSLGWLYRGDTTPQGADADYWSSLWGTPDPSRAAFDCEDGARACYELFHVLQNLPLTGASKRLVALQALARDYTPWLVTGELLSDDGSARSHGAKQYLMHMYLALVPSARADLPTLTVESTDHASGAWCVPRVEPTQSERALHRRLMHAAESHSLEETARVRTPVSMLRAQRMYGKVFTLFTASAPDGHSVHRVCNGDAEQVFGGGLHLDKVSRVVTRVPTHELERDFAAHLALTPRAPFPCAPDDTRMPVYDAEQLELLVARHASKAQVHLVQGMALARMLVV
ncbi:MAG: hypothetical protein Q7V62_04900 [Actinomycetota bacterium]|nr:hypothetical protein [Actinomycetota bacterium]